MGVVVEDVMAVDSAVIDLVLEESEEEVISRGVGARGRLRSGDEEEAILGG